MVLSLSRRIFTPSSTIGALYIDDALECWTLEDTDRDLAQGQTLGDIHAVKVPGKTAIPTGRYEVVVTFSNRFQKDLPLLKDVPGFSGVRIHAGNTPTHTEGCVLVGESYGADAIYHSVRAFNKLFTKIIDAIALGPVFITIGKEDALTAPVPPDDTPA